MRHSNAHVDVEPASPVRDGWVFVAFLSLLVWAPLPLGSNRIWAIGILVLGSVVLLCATLWVWRKHVQLAQSRLAPFHLPLGLLAALVAFSWLQTVPLPPLLVNLLSPAAAAAQGRSEAMTLSLDVFQSQIMAGLSFCYFCVFMVALLCVSTSSRLDTLAQVLVWSGVLQTLLGAVLFSVQAEYRIFFVDVSHTRMIGTFVYHNSFAGYLCMCLSVGVGLMLARLGESPGFGNTWQARVRAAIEFALSPKMRLRLLLVIMVIGLVLTRSRMGNTAFFVSMLVVGLVGLLLARKKAPQTIALIVSLIVIDLVIIGTGVGLEKVMERIQTTELMDADGGKSESVEARTAVGRTAVALVQDYPFAGSGGGSFYNVFLGYRTPQLGNSHWDHAHNDYVEIAADYGLLGLSLLGALVAWTLYKVLQVMAKRRSVLPWGMAFGVAMAIVCLLVHSSVDFNLHIPANALTIVVILAAGLIAGELPTKRQRRRKSSGTGGLT